ncbi:MAG: TIGR03915 family putative DNA repair protein [Desulfuromonadales bacterium]|nr:TIGR03915 family putative DNA repair protein [Desulfuromonadales bacterium]MBN2791101.1 TIGR03915 family putative DNA repair protein [Desulfuromonadales bacterium]
MILHYDGSLCGFLCLVGRGLKEGLPISRIERSATRSGDLFAAELSITSDSATAAEVALRLEKLVGKSFMPRLAHALFSEEDRIEEDLVELFQRVRREGRSLLMNPPDLLVNRIDRAAQRTQRERHRLLGLVRFERLVDSSYLARCRPRTNCVPLLGSHFNKRLGGQIWLIFDEQRKVAVCGDGHHWQVNEQVDIAADLPRHPTETQMSDLWRDFYHSISNPARTNQRLRQQFMPHRYWAFLTELQPFRR